MARTNARKKSRSKSRGGALPEALIEFRRLLDHVAKKLGKGGAVSMKLAGLYKAKVSAAGKSPAQIIDEAIKLFDSDAGNRDKMIEKAISEMASSRAAKAAKKSGLSRSRSKRSKKSKSRGRRTK